MERINWLLEMIFITSNRKLYLFNYFCTVKTQNTEYNYIYVENYIYIYIKKSKKLWKYIKVKQKKHSILAKIYKLCIICSPKFLNMMLSETVLLSFKIINWLRLVLPYRWSRHSYCSFPALIELGFLWQQSCHQGGKIC